MKRAAFNKAMGKVMRKHRLLSGKTMKAIGDEMGCSYQQIAKFESGNNGLSAAQLSRLASIFGIGIALLYEEVGPATHITQPSEAQHDAFLAARYVARITDAGQRRALVDYTRKLAYQGEVA